MCKTYFCSSFFSSEDWTPEETSQLHSGASNVEYTRDHLVRGQRKIDSLIQNTHLHPVNRTFCHSSTDRSPARPLQRTAPWMQASSEIPSVSAMKPSLMPTDDVLRLSSQNRTETYPRYPPRVHYPHNPHSTPTYSTHQSNYVAPSYSSLHTTPSSSSDSSHQPKSFESVFKFDAYYSSETRTDKSGTVTTWSKGSNSYTMTTTDSLEADDPNGTAQVIETTRSKTTSPVITSELQDINLASINPLSAPCNESLLLDPQSDNNQRTESALIQSSVRDGSEVIGSVHDRSEVIGSVHDRSEVIGSSKQQADPK